MSRAKILGLMAVGIILVGGLFTVNTLKRNLSTPVVATATVDLKDGDAYTLTTSKVTKVIGGKTYSMLAYNGSIPGPVLRIPQGARVTITLKNDMNVPTALHSHGVRMENQYDGAPPLTQAEIAPGESFTYKLIFPDAGVYWYHPHVQEGYTQELGLYGTFIVMPQDAGYFPPVNREVSLFLDDILIENGKIPFAKDGVDHALMGRFGTVMLTNGEEQYTLTAQTGEVVRLYVTNAANARPFNFSIEGLKLKLVGGDNGAYEQATWQDGVVLGPSERAIVDVLFPRAGTYKLLNKTPNNTYELGTVTVSDEQATSSYAKEFNTLQSNPDTTASIARFQKYFSAAPDKMISLTVDMGGMNHGGHGMSGAVSQSGIEWEDTGGMGEMGDLARWHIVDVTGNPSSAKATAGKQDMDIDWVFEKDKPVKIEIYNDPNSMHPMQHPIHFHGQRFLVVTRDGVRQTNLVWKDTVLIKSGERVEIILDPSNPGEWMAHCHIAEHLEAGMMMQFRVE